MRYFPLGKIIENTTQPSLDPLTLLVSFDSSGHAEGWLYDDAGDGFGYKNGDYSLIHYVADKSGGEVLIKIKESQGTWLAKHHNVNVEIVVGDHEEVAGRGDDAEGIHCRLNIAN